MSPRGAAPALLALALVGLTVCCNGGASKEPLCTPGRTIACRGAGDCDGAEACLSDGSGYGACVCLEGDAGGETCTADLQSDPMNCGACFNPCAPAQTCGAGRCVCQPDPAPPSFSADVVPIFASSCTSGTCHHVAGPKSLSLLAGEAYAELVNVPAAKCAKPRFRVAPGAPESSYLVDKLLGVRLCAGLRMPLEGAITQDEIATVARWICAGALDD